MRTNMLLVLLATFLVSLAVAEQTITIQSWPLSASKCSSLAKITYTANNATVKSYTPPTVPSYDDSIIRIGFTHPTTGKWSGVATAASNFQPGKDKKITLHLDTAGELFHVGFVAGGLPSSSGSGKGKEAKGGDDVLGVEVVRTRQGSTPQLNKPVVLDAEGKVPTKEVEKSFFQKYWWVIAGFLLLQVVMGGAKE